MGDDKTLGISRFVACINYCSDHTVQVRFISKERFNFQVHDRADDSLDFLDNLEFIIYTLRFLKTMIHTAIDIQRCIRALGKFGTLAI